MAAKEDIALTIERQAAARRLLADPLITVHSHPEDFALVQAHSDWLVRQFRRVLGYELLIADDHARLVKTGLVHTVTTPLLRDSGAPFTPRAYTYMALTLAALPDAGPRTTVAELAAGVRAAAEEAGLALDPEARLGERRAFVAGLTRLVGWGVLTETGDGSPTTPGTAPAKSPWPSTTGSPRTCSPASRTRPPGGVRQPGPTRLGLLRRESRRTHPAPPARGNPGRLPGRAQHGPPGPARPPPVAGRSGTRGSPRLRPGDPRRRRGLIMPAEAMDDPGAVHPTTFPGKDW